MAKTAYHISLKGYVEGPDFDRATDVTKAKSRGKTTSKFKLHSQEMMLAHVASPLAIENAHGNLLEMEDDE
ncbi:MAG: hypothetical protein K2M41_06585 [Muribaculaceae bacterium]|nr:hypothetical protein [Muribaculaceae bacterium]